MPVPRFNDNLTVIPEEILTTSEPTQIAETIADTLAEALPKVLPGPVAEPVAEPLPDTLVEPLPEALVEPVAEHYVKSDKEQDEVPDAGSVLLESKSESLSKWAPIVESDDSSEGAASESVSDVEGMPDTTVPEIAELNEKELKKARLKAMPKGYFAFREQNAAEEDAQVEDQADEEEAYIAPITTYISDLIAKDQPPSVNSFNLNDYHIEKLLQEVREDEDDNVDTALSPKPTGINTLTLKDDFLKHFELPSLSDISEEHEIIVKPVFKRRGTQAVLKSHRRSSTTTVESADTALETSSSDGLDNMPLSKFESLAKMPENQKPKIVEIDPFVLFKQEIEYGFTDEAFAAERQKKLSAMTMDFMKDIINKVVTTVETNRAARTLSAKLDKESLFWRLKDEVEQYNYQKDLNHFLNGRMADYYKRMKSTRQFQALPQDSLIAEFKRRDGALKQYDHALKVSKETLRKVSYLMASVLMDLTYVDNIERGTEEHLENCITKTLINDKRSPHFVKVVNAQIDLMSRTRDEVSDERLALITRKHTLARIYDKILTLEQVSETICVNDFIHVQNDVVALGKKIEEKNNELRKLRANYDMDLHLTQHNRDKTLSLEFRLREAKQKFRDIQKKQRKLREQIYKGKVKRNKLRKEIADVVYAGGLLTMPLLMHDYDETVEEISSLQAKVKETKETMHSMNKKIADYEASISVKTVNTTKKHSGSTLQ